ncbi:ribonuclease H-like domain-containing protein [Fennellomyces sp. T-0311]|nr:ribonuclease H-like domain-containing protein [Fennellomyces sp. T-0311]
MDSTKKRKADELGSDDHEEDRKQHLKTEENGIAPEVKTDPTKPEDNQPVSVVPFDCLIVLHVEATCDENLTNPAAIQVTKENSEIIDLAFVVLDTTTMEVVHDHHILVRPERTPLTNFCTQITNITWDKLSSAGTFKDAIREFDQYVQEEILSRDKSFCFVTHGGWILRIQMAREAMDKNLELPEYLSMYQMFDLKQEVQRWQMQHHPEISLRTTSLTDLCEAFHIERPVTDDPGMDAALTVAMVVRHLTSFCHPDVFTKPIHYGADVKRFKNEESKVVRIAGLPYELTQGELEAWFSSNGLRPSTTWMIQTTEHSKPSLSGFVLFQSHDEALRALRLNGRCLGDRPIEVAPSSEHVIEQAGGLLTSFPVQANNRRLRPGDWMCPNCSFHNFASRRNCFKCNAESPHNNTNNPSATPPSSTPTSNFTPGDWLCPNTTCQFHNYSSRNQCWKCGTDRPQATNKPANPSSSTPTTPTGPAAATVATPVSRHQVRPGDWFCPNPECCFQNFASRTACYRCHTPNPHPPAYPQQQYSYADSAAAAATGATPYHTPVPVSTQYRAGDWICTACSTHNFANRQQCLFCGAARTSMSPSALPTGVSTALVTGFVRAKHVASIILPSERIVRDVEHRLTHRWR